MNSVLIYILLGIVLFLFTWPTEDATGEKKLYFFRIAIAILAFSFIMGCRYGVGRDYMGMLDIYEARRLGLSLSYLDYYEPFFYFITTLLADLGAHFSFYFGVIAFFQISFLILTFRKYPKILPFIFLFFSLECVWFAWANIMRQSLAQSLFILSISFLAEKKNISFLICIILGTMAHDSILLMSPLVFFYFRKDVYWINIPRQLVLFFGALGVFLARWDGILNMTFHITNLLSSERYGRYLLSDERLQGVESFGVGFWVLCCINLILILFSNKVKAFYNNRFINILYDLFFFGILIEYLCQANMLIGRFNVFFIDNRFILCGFYFYYFLHVIPEKTKMEQGEQQGSRVQLEEFFQARKRKLISYLLAAVLFFANLAVFIGYLSKDSDPSSSIIYHFFWEFV